MPISDTAEFLTAAAAEGSGFSAAKIPSLDSEAHHVRVLEDDRIVAIGAYAIHEHADGSAHAAVETVVERSMQFPAFEEAVVAATIAIVDETLPVSVWSQRPTLDRALEALGFEPSRSLAFMVGELPLPGPRVDDRSMRTGEWDRIVAINNAAFARHREAGVLTVEEAMRTMTESGFDESGVRVIDVDGDIAAFCWTKVHPDHDGEIYRIAVDPDHQGKGLGRAAVLAGYRWLDGREGVERATLWVDESNEPAIRLYQDIGLEIERRNREFTRR